MVSKTFLDSASRIKRIKDSNLYKKVKKKVGRAGQPAALPPIYFNTGSG
jgi:hypothetical protein